MGIAEQIFADSLATTSRQRETQIVETFPADLTHKGIVSGDAMLALERQETRSFNRIIGNLETSVRRHDQQLVDVGDCCSDRAKEISEVKTRVLDYMVRQTEEVKQRILDIINAKE